MSKSLKASSVRNIIFGAEDSLVSTVGVLFGVATAYPDKTQILLTGLIIIFVEALSMGVGSFLSESSSEEIDKNLTKRENPTQDGIVMFLSYFISGFIILVPYLFLQTDAAKYTSLLLGIIALFVVGYLPAKNVKSAIRMVILGGLAVAVGFFVASFFGSKI